MGSGVVMDKQIHSFSWNHHRETFFKTVFNLKQQEIFCDLTLACEGLLFPVHRLVLAMCSEFFNEILTKIPHQQPMIMLVPGVEAADLESLLKYIYQGEIQVSQASLPSLLKAAHTLKIKGLCSTSKSPLNQYTRQTQQSESGEPSTTTAERIGDSIDVDEDDDSCDSVMSLPPPTQPQTQPPSMRSLQDTLQQQSKRNKKAKNSRHAFPQVEVFINNEEESQDLVYEADTKEEEDESMKNDWFENEDEQYLDPLNVPLLSPIPLTFDSPDSEYTDGTSSLPLEVSLKMDEDQDQYFSTTTIAASGPVPSSATSSTANFRYTREQKLQIVQNYYIYGPCRTPKLMSERLGRKMNESSVRSVVKAWERHQARVFP